MQLTEAVNWEETKSIFDSAILQGFLFFRTENPDGPLNSMNEMDPCISPGRTIKKI